jgi:hypothetical protein
MQSGSYAHVGQLSVTAYAPLGVAISVYYNSLCHCVRARAVAECCVILSFTYVSFASYPATVVECASAFEPEQESLKDILL